MAFKWLLFCAHKGEAVLCRSFCDTADALSKEFSLSDAGVHDAITFVAGRVFGPSAEFLAKEDVLNSMGFQCLTQGFPVELWVPTAIRSRSHIANGCHALLLQQFEEVLNRVI